MKIKRLLFEVLSLNLVALKKTMKTLRLWGRALNRWHPGNDSKNSAQEHGLWHPGNNKCLQLYTYHVCILIMSEKYIPLISHITFVIGCLLCGTEISTRLVVFLPSVIFHSSLWFISALCLYAPINYWLLSKTAGIHCLWFGYIIPAVWIVGLIVT